MPPPSDAPGRDKAFPVRHVAAIDPKPKDALWLVESLWAASGVGIVAGLPKALKTWVATELAVAVASGKDALGRFPVKQVGPVLVYCRRGRLALDALPFPGGRRCTRRHLEGHPGLPHRLARAPP